MDTKIVKRSIWLMLPVSIILIYILVLATGYMDWMNLWAIPFMILTYGAFIWIPSMLMTFTLESLVIRKESSLGQVAVVFGIETILTFVIIALIFGGLSTNIPVLALAMSIVIQLCRIAYIRHRLKQFSSTQEEKSHQQLRIIK